MDSSRYIATHVASLPKSGIRDFFDIVAKMKDAISLGVGLVLRSSFRHARGVGQDEDPVATVRRTNAGSRYTVPFRIIPERGKVAENGVESPSSECCHVLSDDEPGS